MHPYIRFNIWFHTFYNKYNGNNFRVNASAIVWKEQRYSWQNTNERLFAPMSSVQLMVSQRKLKIITMCLRYEDHSEFLLILVTTQKRRNENSTVLCKTNMIMLKHTIMCGFGLMCVWGMHKFGSKPCDRFVNVNFRFLPSVYVTSHELCLGQRVLNSIFGFR